MTKSITVLKIEDSHLQQSLKTYNNLQFFFILFFFFWTLSIRINQQKFKKSQHFVNKIAILQKIFNRFAFSLLEPPQWSINNQKHGNLHFYRSEWFFVKYMNERYSLLYYNNFPLYYIVVFKFFFVTFSLSPCRIKNSLFLRL